VTMRRVLHQNSRCRRDVQQPVGRTYSPIPLASAGGPQGAVAAA